MTEMQLPGFEVIEKLGQGGMATVWKARQISLDRVVAIKILSSRLASAKEDVDMFQKEAQQAAKLKHPGIIQVYDANAYQGLYYFVMEYVAGYTVGDWIRRKGVLPEKDVLLVAECVADALEYAWDTARMIHCDIKPDNVIIDADGTVKIADLGLARTISAMTEEGEVEEVMGTPAYISPEQAMGKTDMDYRADIYSLGAMLYHLATGKLLFEGYPDDQVMEMQVSGVVDDALDLNPGLSKPLCWLLEKMLAKEPDWRPANWQEVRKDVDRVKKGIMPIGCIKDEHHSTVARSVKRTRRDLKKSVRVPDSENASSGGMKKVVFAVVLVIAILGVLSVLNNKKEPPVVQPVAPVVPQNVPSQNNEELLRDKQAMEMYEFAREWAKNNPDSYPEAIDRFNTVVSQTSGTKYSLMAKDEIDRLKSKWDTAKKNVIVGLKQQTEYFVKNEEFDHAANLYEKYAGPLKKDTEVERYKLAQDLRDMKKKKEDERLAHDHELEQKFTDILTSIVDKLLDEGVLAALDIANKALYDRDLVNHKEQISSVKNVLNDASRIDQRILDSFKEQIGTTIIIGLEAGNKQVRIEGIRDGKIMAKHQFGASKALVGITYDVSELSVRERLGRMGNDSDPDVALVKGLMAVKSGSTSYAKTYFSKTHELLAERLLARLEGSQTQKKEEDAKQILIRSLAAVGITVPPEFNEWEWGAVLEGKEFSDTDAKKLAQLANSFREKYGETEFGLKAVPFLDVLATVKVAELTPDKPAEADVAPAKAKPLTPELEAAAGDKGKLAELIYKANSGLGIDDLSILTDSAGTIYKITMSSQHIRDIGPIAACKNLREFSCSALRPGQDYGDLEATAPVSDITPLIGLPLEKLNLSNTSIKAIDALKGMRLQELNISRTKVTDLAPVKSMKLETLDVSNTMVKDIKCLTGCRITTLNLAGTRVFEFKPLSTMSLEHLGLDDTQFKDLGQLRGLRLRGLSIANTKVMSLEGLAEMPLDYLNIEGTAIKDITPMEKMSLKRLNISNTNIKDLSVIDGLPLNRLEMKKTAIKDIEFVKKMNLQYLNIEETSVDDLSPLKDTGIVALFISNTRVRDLSPLAGTPIKYLIGMGIKADMTPLLQTRLEEVYLTIDDPPAAMRILMRIPSLRSVNGRSLKFGPPHH